MGRGVYRGEGGGGGGGRGERSQKGGAAAGGLRFPVWLHTHILHLPSLREERWGGGLEGEKGQRKQPLWPNYVKMEVERTGQREKWGRKWSGFQPKYDKTSMNLKHGGVGGSKEGATQSQWLNPVVWTHKCSVCVCALTWLCLSIRVLSLCKLVQLVTAFHVYGRLWSSVSLFPQLLMENHQLLNIHPFNV